ncbi:nucleotidyltransferase family protein [Paenibacillus albidus]|uniref:nucleotidyltransferase family protein n=1 Tax=Paenibacillus albidus TaxID=2041023 RepID=UPI001BEA47AD|nr:nucleotidyltransferase family protein [Paenibacillus albidus]MBT2289915.1 nucleotidyltransferase family protein [Paenibacillus albidus]
MRRMYNEEDIMEAVRADPWMMDTLRAVRSLELPDWWVCAGFVRSKVWDVQHGFTDRTPLPDVDVIYFDETDRHEKVEKEWEARLSNLKADVPWSVKNQARMHLLNNQSPYTSSTDAMSRFPETATALGISLDGQDQLILAAPHGFGDVVNMVIHPTPDFAPGQPLAFIYEQRIAKKNWGTIWNQVQHWPLNPGD